MRTKQPTPLARHVPSPGSTLADIAAELVALRAQVERLAVVLEQRPDQAPPAREWLTVAEAAALALRTPRTITAWCCRYQIGVRVGASWRIDRAHLRRFLIDRNGAARLPPGLR